MRTLEALLSLAVVLVAASSQPALSEPSAADAIAEKFSAASPSEPPLKQSSDKAVAARQKAMAAKKRADTARAIALRREEEAARLHTQYEADILARAKAELAERVAEQKRAEEDAARADAEAERLAEAEARRRVVENRRREEAARAAALSVDQQAKEAVETAENDRRAALEAQREAETLRLAGRLKAARRAKAAELEQRELEIANLRETDAQVSPHQEAAVIETRSGEAIDAANGAVRPPDGPHRVATPAPAVSPPPSPAPATLVSASRRASVMLVLEPGDYGLRRFNPNQADPVLCLGDTCYISQGSSAPARALPRSQALGPGNTLGGRAGACKLQLACVFRDVDLGASGTAEIMPVDLHVLRHDRREIATITADRTCTFTGGRLACAAPLKSATYRALVVPESIAALASGAGLTAALKGLAADRTASK